MLFREDLKRIADKARAKAFAQCGEPADVIISCDPMHVGYLCGYRSVMLDVDRHYRTAVIATPEEAYLVTGAGDTAPALEVMRDPSRIFRYGVFYVSHSGAGADLSVMPKSASSFADALRAAGYEILNEVALNQVLVSFGDPETTHRVIQAIQQDGTCWAGGTVWQGRTAMRISVSSWETTEEDVERSLEAILRIAGEVRAGQGSER
ncbi:MAG: hypothetical protein HUU31_22835 [Anaerolineae bacterium]|nr:hypothetical protein [Anaerolineae bacterium]